MIGVIKKALCGLVTSGELWHKQFSEDLSHLGFTTKIYDRDVWIQKNKTTSHMSTSVPMLTIKKL